MSPAEFLCSIDDKPMSALDRALAVLWWIGRENPYAEPSVSEIVQEIEASGQPRQNSSRLSQQIRKDPRAIRAGSKGWRLHPQARKELDQLYQKAQRTPKALPNTDSVLPDKMFSHSRNYIARVVEQINKSYDVGLWDCCAVMCRRLLETLIIEAYETAGRASEIKGNDANFLMLNGLVTHLEKDKGLHLGRSAMKGLKDFKQLGDLSAHNRRFNARQNDIDRVRDGLRIASEELLHLAGFPVVH